MLWLLHGSQVGALLPAVMKGTLGDPCVVCEEFCGQLLSAMTGGVSTSNHRPKGSGWYHWKSCWKFDRLAAQEVRPPNHVHMVPARCR